MAYKKNTGDARESPAARVVELLVGLGARVHAADPLVVEGHVDARVVRVEASVAEVAAADAVVLLTDHDQFDLDTLAGHARYLLDCRHRVHGPTVETP